MTEAEIKANVDRLRKALPATGADRDVAAAGMNLLEGFLIGIQRIADAQGSRKDLLKTP